MINISIFLVQCVILMAVFGFLVFGMYINHEGQGVGCIDGFAVFVDGALVGESMKVKIIKVLKNYAVGKLLEIKVSSIVRIEPFCLSYRRYGGCSLQHMIRSGFKTGEIMIVVVINGQDLPRKSQLVDSLFEQVPGVKSIVLNINTEKTNVILGEKNPVVYGDDTITDYMGDLKFYISPLSLDRTCHCHSFPIIAAIHHTIYLKSFMNLREFH